MVKKDKINVAILGSTGMIGQVFAWLLADHPEFEIAAICASDANAGKQYLQAATWNLPFFLPEKIKVKKIEPIDYEVFREKNISIVFSALPSQVASDIEKNLRENGFFVFSNASAFRYDEEVPILIPEANLKEIQNLKNQMIKYNGAIVTNANCSTTGLAAVLAPLKKFGILDVFVSTYQSVSGAGYPGMPSLDILGNVIPLIKNEEEKMKIELQKILNIKINIFPFCARVPVVFGHLETVWVRFKKNVEIEEIKERWYALRVSPKTHSIPKISVQYMEQESFPQSKHSFMGDPPGMTVFTGRLKKEGDYIGLVLMVNNIVKGGAGGSVQNAELFKKYYGEIL